MVARPGSWLTSEVIFEAGRRPRVTSTLRFVSDFFFGRKIVVVFEDRGKEDEREENLVIFTQERHALIREILARP